jgi:TfoX/Sxy family transcriptional regulator of competence genes
MNARRRVDTGPKKPARRAAKSPPKHAATTSAEERPAPRASASLVLHLQDSLQEIIDGFDGVVRRKVLSSDGWFKGGKLFALVTKQARIVVRLPEESAQNELLSLAGASEWKIGKKAPMRSWIQVPERMHDDADALSQWLKRAWFLAPGTAAAKSRIAKKASKKAKSSAGRSR